MRLDRSKDVTVHVLICTSCNFSALMTVCGSFSPNKTYPFLGLVAKMSDQFLEQRNNVKFCVKIGNNANDTYAVLSGTYGGECMRKSNVSEWHKQFKESSHFEITNEGNAHHFLRYQGYRSL
jgi:hypothetical protein